MATVTSYNAQRMKAIEDSTVIRGAIEAEDQLILYTRDGTRINAGTIKGGAPEWIQEYTPIIQNHDRIMGETKDTLDELYADMEEVVKPVLEEMDYVFTETLPALQQSQQQASTNAIAALEKAQQAQDKADDTIKIIARQYCLHVSATDPPGFDYDWVTTPPLRTANHYIWERLEIVRNNDEVSYTEPVMMTGDVGPKGADGVDAVVVYIQSTKGVAFKNNKAETQLNVTVYNGAVEITNIQQLWSEFGPAAYLEWEWLRIEDDEFGIISSADSRLSRSGFTLSITPADVDTQTTFRCILNV